MSNIIDARGLPCPQPVILTRNAIRDVGDQQTGQAMVVLVSTEDQAHNVQRLAEKKGWGAKISVDGESFRLDLSAGVTMQEATPAASPQPTLTQAHGGPTVVLVTSDKMGEGDDTLGDILMRAFFHTLTEVEPLPDLIILYNGGVKLAVEGATVAEDLVILEESGVEILACGTCLNHFGLSDKLVVGSVSNMYTIAETLLEAGHIVRP